jgi:hypothetical protein
LGFTLFLLEKSKNIAIIIMCLSAAESNYTVYYKNNNSVKEGICMLEKQDQIVHDTILSVAAEKLRKIGRYEVYTNPGQEKKVDIAGFYPDIILTNKGSKIVRFIIEVETNSSVNEYEVDQWKKFAALGAIFYLLVPRSVLDTAKRLCIDRKVDVKFGYYWEDSSGDLQISYENGS